MSVVMNVLDLNLPDFICNAIDFLFLLLVILWGIIDYYIKPIIGDLLAVLLSIVVVIFLLIPALILGTPVLILSVLLAIAIVIATILWKIFGKKK